MAQIAKALKKDLESLDVSSPTSTALLCDVMSEVSRGVEMANIYFKDNDIKARAFPPYAFCIDGLGLESKDT